MGLEDTRTPAGLGSVLSRWPALQGTGPALTAALREVRYAHRPGGGPDDLSAAEPLLARWMEQGSGALRREALGAWLSVVGGQPGSANVQALLTAARRDPDRDFLVDVLEGAGPLVDAGALPLLTGYARHEDWQVRRALARGLGLSARPAQASRLLEGLLDDPDSRVRAAAAGAMARAPDGAERLVRVALEEQSEEVLRACVPALVSDTAPGEASTALERLASHPSAGLRRHVAGTVAEVQRRHSTLLQVTGRLLADPEAEVRRECAWCLRVAGPHQAVEERLQQLLRDDPAEEVRVAAAGTLATVLEASDLAALLTGLSAHPAPALFQEIAEVARSRPSPEFVGFLALTRAAPEAEAEG